MLRAALAVVLALSLAGTLRAQSAPVNAPEDAARVEEFSALVEGNNSASARRLGARELLRLNTPVSQKRFVAILSSSNRPARAAAAAALAEFPQYHDPQMLGPLLQLLGDPDAETRSAAVAALGAASNDATRGALRDLLSDARGELGARLAALEALAAMTDRTATGLLVEQTDKPAPIGPAALQALNRALALELASAAAVREWWEHSRGLSDDQWRELRVQRTIRDARVARERCAELEQRLSAALRDGYLRAAEAERPALLAAFLADAQPAVRALGLELARLAVQDAKRLPADLLPRVRDLLSAPTPSVRLAAVKTVAALRDPEDEARLLQMLPVETDRDVRIAVVGSLGFTGSGRSAGQLLALLADADTSVVDEAVASLGRLAERGVLDSILRASVADEIRTRLSAAPREDVRIRERLLDAAAKLADAGFASAFVAALEPGEPPTLRLAALRGLVGLLDPRRSTMSQPVNGAARERELLIDALIAQSSDADPAVRRLAIETLAAIAASDIHLAALWSRIDPAAEPDEAIRGIAWDGAVRVLATRPPEEIELWIARLPIHERPAEHALELWLAAENHLQSRAEQREALGLVRSQLAAQRAAAGQIDEALATYATALRDLLAVQSPQTVSTTVAMLTLALSTQRYDSSLAANLRLESAEVDQEQVWSGLHAELERQLTPESAAMILRSVEQLAGSRPNWLPELAWDQLAELERRARAVLPPQSQATP